MHARLTGGSRDRASAHGAGALVDLSSGDWLALIGEGVDEAKRGDRDDATLSERAA